MPNQRGQNARFHILAGNRRPLVLSVGSELLRVSRRWRSNSFASDFCAHIIHDLRVHWETRSRIVVGFAQRISGTLWEQFRRNFLDSKQSTLNLFLLPSSASAPPR